MYKMIGNYNAWQYIIFLNYKITRVKLRSD